MKITLSDSAGFCFGVKRAIKIAKQVAKNSNNAYMLGDIVHNEDVVRDIKKTGIKKIKKLTVGKNKILLIRAHGTSIKVLTEAAKCGFKIVDATCPMVKEIHKIAQKMDRKGYKIIVIGDNKHDEVQGIIGQIKEKAIVITDTKDIPSKELKKTKKAAVVVQSTQNTEKVQTILTALTPLVGELKFFNTICKPTRAKQEEIRKLACENEVMIIIGSKTSANTKRLYEIAKSLNKKSFWVESEKDLKREWFKGVQRVGIDAGASTPNSTTQRVIDQVRYYA